jgi:hypothetical protein
MLLPQAVRDDLRARRVPAKVVNSMFTDDHIGLHSLGGSDAWWNLDPRQRGPELKAKDNRDTSRAAKVKRNDAKWREFTKAMGRKRPGTGKQKRKRKTRWPYRPMNGARHHGKNFNRVGTR